MSKNGVWQLKKLVINYCEFSGSSKYVRNILGSSIKQFKELNPQIQVEESVVRGGHPSLLATYESGVTKFVPLRGREEDKVVKHMENLRDTSGERPRKFGDRYVKKTESIQGLWNPFINFKSAESTSN
ncbi:hypothetical protein DICPUDRAFT_30259 [Dictyostelium purpureum]|uniref:Large ribosomal subunit protein mL43 n=1 Tax=Dictyostelium purpureum TaxID=5786 RepID=F0ZF23_DICPU|nr:uncharacterized protein DICPUDRAFT_30259 [Dictyostelium purpureum]EGC37460.1 hypothetical protein DICPUDRAFT_30259 [Dictyostelium purpureum]|eukprot:XP_003286024.1 hypothetical protein DICPUDRAFT_30259 [Dictyostelium purpureum]